DGRAAHAREAHDALLHLVVAQGGTVVFVDVPVQLDRVLLDLGLAVAGRGQRAGVEAVRVGGRDDVEDVLLGHVAAADGGVGQTNARGGTGVLLVVGEEEQLVLHDRAADGGTVGDLVVEAGEVGGVALQARTHHVLVAVGRVHAARQASGTGLRHGVNDGTGATEDGGVVVGQVDVDFLDRVHRDRLALGREVVGLQAEGIAGADAVDADRVEAGVLATGRDRAIGLADLRDARVEADVVLHVAVGRRQRVHLLAGHVDAGAHLVGAEHVRAADVGTDDFHALQGGHVAFQAGVDRVDLVQVEVHALFGLGAFTGLGHGDGIRTADAETASVVTTRRVGDGAAAGTGLDVDAGHFGASPRLAAIADHHAADTGGGALGERRSSSKGGDQSKGELGHPESTVIGHGKRPQEGGKEKFQPERWAWRINDFPAYGTAGVNSRLTR